MRNDLTKKRTFLFCGHAQSGKTSISEAALFKCGAVNRLGKVDEGTTTSDYEDDEKERKSSVNLSVLHCEYKDKFLQFIDVPGYLDFIGELVSSSRAVDFGVLVVDAEAGVEVGTEKAWEILRRENIPSLFFINKLDKENTNFDKIAEDIKNNLAKKSVVLGGFKNGNIFSLLKEKIEPYYSAIVESAAESDDTLIEKYLEKGTIDEKELWPALRKAVLNSQIFPVVGGTALNDKGIDVLLDVITEIMPAVSETKIRKIRKGSEEIVIEPKIDAPLIAQVFKTIIEPFVGHLSIFRVFSGKVSSNSDIFNVTKDSKEKIGQIYLLQGKQQISQEVISAGEIGAAAKMKDADTLDVLSNLSAGLEFPSLEFPLPVYSASVKPKTRQDEDKISSALSRLVSEDPTFKVLRDAQTKELVISGMGELHLNVIIERMRRRYGADVELGTPKIPYRETITKSVKVQGKYKKQSGGRGQYGDCWIEVEPLERGKEFEFVDKVVGGAIPRNFIPSIEKGVRHAMAEGILAGFPVSDIRVILFDGSYHPVDSSDISFQVAGGMAFKKALEQGGTVLLEPVMNVEITVPEEVMGQVTGDINSKRGRVLGMEVKGKNQMVKACIPLSEMSKYASDLRSFTGGRGTYSMSFSHLEIVPARIAQAVIEKVKSAKENN